MFNEELVRKIKASTVVIGCRYPNESLPRQIFGTGFVINSEGYVATASHVYKSCLQFCKKSSTDKEKIVPTIIKIVSEGTKSDVSIREIEKGILIELNSLVTGNSEDTDVGILKPVDLGSNLPFLKISDQPLHILDEIAMCGYPGGNSLVSISKKIFDIRLNSSFQLGRISGLLPIDTVDFPQGIQTDIIGTGGSSGSPIVNKEGAVIGIAQSVIGSSVFIPTKEGVKMGSSNIGMVFGLSNHVLKALPDILDTWKSGNENKLALKDIKFTIVKNLKPSHGG